MTGMTDQQALQVFFREEESPLPTLELLAEASCIAFRRLQDCQWHDYVIDDPKLYACMCPILLDIEYDDGSSSTVFGHIGIDLEGHLICIPNHPTYYSDRAKIRHWARTPRYDNRCPKE